MRRRIWCETCPWEELVQPATLRLLRVRGIEPIVAVRPGDVARLARAEAAVASAGLQAAYWPMLADEDGRWAGRGNLEKFGALAREVVDAAGAVRRGAVEIVVDLEPPIEPTRRLAEVAGPTAVAAAAMGGLASLRDLVRHVSPRGVRAAGVQLAALVDDLGARGARVSACVLPPLVVDRRGWWGALLGTPVAGPRWHEVHVMLYSSLLEGWSRGVVRREDARALVHRLAAAARRTWGARSSVALGVVGPGAFGDEPTYRDFHELADDVALAEDAGATHLSLFDQGGVLRRSEPETWLDAFVSPREGRRGVRGMRGAPPSLRARALYGFAELLGGG